MTDNIHKGHRVRLKQEFINGAFNDDTADYKWLELLLFYCIPQRDTNPLAHELINRFHSLSGVLEAPIEELTKINGITENVAVLLKMIIPLNRKCELEKSEMLFNFPDRSCGEQYILKQFYGLTNERVGILLMNQIGRIIDFKFLGEGTFCEVGISIRQIVKYALDNNAQNIIIAHNHPGALALPSGEDINATKLLINTLSRLNIRLIDHIIVSGNDYVSLAQSQKYAYIFE